MQQRRYAAPQRHLGDGEAVLRLRRIPAASDRDRICALQPGCRKHIEDWQPNLRVAEQDRGRPRATVGPLWVESSLSSPDGSQYLPEIPTLRLHTTK